MGKEWSGLRMRGVDKQISKRFHFEAAGLDGFIVTAHVDISA
jgi:hypothetical protein